MIQEPRSFRINTALNLQMTDLAEREQVPPLIIRFITVEVVRCQDATGHRWTSATDALVASAFSGFSAFLFAVSVIFVSEVSHKFVGSNKAMQPTSRAADVCSDIDAPLPPET